MSVKIFHPKTGKELKLFNTFTKCVEQKGFLCDFLHLIDDDVLQECIEVLEKLENESKLKKPNKHDLEEIIAVILYIEALHENKNIFSMTGEDICKLLDAFHVSLILELQRRAGLIDYETSSDWNFGGELTIRLSENFFYDAQKILNSDISPTDGGTNDGSDRKDLEISNQAEEDIAEHGTISMEEWERQNVQS